MAVITKAEFESRLSDDERAAIRNAAGNHIIVYVWLEIFDAVQVIDTTFAPLRRALLWFESLGATALS